MPSPDDFDAIFDTRIAPALAQLEDERKAVVKGFRMRGAPISVLFAASAAAGAWVLSSDVMLAGFALLFSGVVAFAIAFQPLQRTANRAKERALGAILQPLGVSFTISGFVTPDWEGVRRWGLAPGYDRSSFEDLFVGVRKGCAFALYEAHLEKETRDKDGDRSYHTVFRGQILSLAYPKLFTGAVIVRRDGGIFNAFSSPGSGFERVGVADPEFERAFEIWGTDQVMARHVVDLLVLERLLELERAMKGARLRCAFADGKVLIALEGKDKFEAGSMFTSLLDRERARRIFTDVASVFALIDVFVERDQAAARISAGTAGLTAT
jgi:hypothetical protein